MGSNHNQRGGNQPSPVIAQQPAAVPKVEPVSSPVVAAVPAPVLVEAAPAATSVERFVDLTPTAAANALAAIAPQGQQGAFELRAAEVLFPGAVEAQGRVVQGPPLPLVPSHTHVAKTRIYVDGSMVEPGEAFTPSAADAALWLSQGCIAVAG